ncbi:helicase-related protein [Sphingosinicella sp. LHD-64]|uniref:helicase-related protein n=1 Tax=Sphingosinicella sp. LHD-64 TaxID=3072139 RepID=UPI00280E9F80|nr:helicase-related protein [Sphingosinicella sp. LHD-64]MDQ8756648.1 helicase-related protein [Sphingosinicella sp. LHD-64]
MTVFARAPLKAILGPTNTGKTHLAVERMCAHSSGMIGFPLRLLAREVYDRIVKMKGEKQVALLTGEEKILPEGARWFCCTAESMPIGGGVFAGAGNKNPRDFAFVALDEAQLGADPERGHVFTDRLLHARGREETMILGSESLKPMVRALLPDAEIIGRPRFSTLSYAGPAKLSRLPPRSAIVAFSAEQVYAVAEMLRRMRGGAAVVMGALSPRTRNAQVAMYQAGEVDYLVATDAIGMGLNMDVAHVAFAGLSKFDGNRRRRLTPAEMAQIAGRAGRHQRDGTFGSLTFEGGAQAEFRPEEIEAIEEHRFAPLDFLYWRESDLDFRGIEPLIRSLERRPSVRSLRAAPEAIDLAVLKLLSADPVAAGATRPDLVRRLWAACGLPDFRKTGPEHHARLVARIFGHLSEGSGHIPQDWFASEVAKLDNVQGDIDTLADRLAGIRTWAYVAHRSDWLAAPAEMAERAMAVEEKLSEALHERLTQRFVDRRTAVLMRDLGRKGAGEFPVLIDEAGEVSVGSYAIGKLSGFAFEVDPAARHADRKMLLATAERRLAGEYEKRAAALVADTDDHFALGTEADKPVSVLWRGHEVARLGPGKNLLSPRVQLDRRIDSVSPQGREAVIGRLRDWIRDQVGNVLGPLRAAGHAAQDLFTPAHARALLALLVDEGGIVARDAVAGALVALDKDQRRAVTALGVRIGALDVFMPAVLKPEAMRWRAALRAAQANQPMPQLPPGSSVVLPMNGKANGEARLGFRAAGPQWIRVDMAERMARQAHEARSGRDRPPVNQALVTSLGLKPEAVTRLMRELGFREVVRESDEGSGWVWRGRGRPRPVGRKPGSGHAFAALAELKRG